MIYYSAPISKFVNWVETTPDITNGGSQIATGGLLTAGKIAIPEASKEAGGIVTLDEITIAQQDGAGSDDLEKQALLLYLFNNSDVMTNNSKGNNFQLDSNTKANNVLYRRSFDAADWFDIGNTDNCGLHAKDLNVKCSFDDAESRTLYYSLVANDATGFSFTNDHNLWVTFKFLQELK